MRLIEDKEAAEYLGLSEMFLKKSRCQAMIDVYGVQPSEANNREASVLYDKDWLDEYLGNDRDRHS